MADSRPDEAGPGKSEESVRDNIEDLVEAVLGENLPEPEVEDPWERRERSLESWGALILGIAAVAAAWSSFQAGEWNNEEVTLQSASVIQRSDAGRAATAATADRIIDTQTWLEWVSAVNAGDRAKSAFLSERFSEPLKIAQREWLTTAQVDAQGVPVVIPPGTPMDLPSYVLPDQVAADAAADRAEELLIDASEASGHSTAFVLVAVLLALVLFFASVATKLRQPKAQVVLSVASIVLLGIAVVQMILLPQQL